MARIEWVRQSKNRREKIRRIEGKGLREKRKEGDVRKMKRVIRRIGNFIPSGEENVT